MQIKKHEDPANSTKYAILTVHEWALLCILQNAKVAPFDAMNITSPETYMWATDYEIGEMQNVFAAYEALTAPLGVEYKLVMEGNRGVMVKK